RAALGGGLAASIAGSRFNDSGPLLLFIGVVSLTFVTAYLRSPPQSMQAALTDGIEGERAAPAPTARAANADRAGGVAEDDSAAPPAESPRAATGPARSTAGTP